MNAVAKLEHTPFGSAFGITGAEDITRRFAGLDHDALTGMHNAVYRTYAPAQARWLQPDPLGMVDGPNVYAYTRNAPDRLPSNCSSGN